MPDDDFLNLPLEETRQRLAYEYRTRQELKAKYDAMMETRGDLNRRLLALSETLIGNGAEMRIAPGKRDAYKSALIEVIRFWRASRR